MSCWCSHPNSSVTTYVYVYVCPPVSKGPTVILFVIWSPSQVSPAGQPSGPGSATTVLVAVWAVNAGKVGPAPVCTHIPLGEVLLSEIVKSGVTCSIEPKQEPGKTKLQLVSTPSSILKLSVILNVQTPFIWAPSNAVKGFVDVYIWES